MGKKQQRKFKIMNSEGKELNIGDTVSNIRLSGKYVGCSQPANNYTLGSFSIKVYVEIAGVVYNYFPETFGLKTEKVRHNQKGQTLTKEEKR